jgi:16S rRNA processing protein RimM
MAEDLTPHGPEPDEVVVGRVGRPHGVRGEVTVELRTDEPERRFAVGAVLSARRPSGGPDPAYRRLTVAGTRWHQDRLLLRFEEVPDRDAAEAARGLLLQTRVDRSESPEDPEEFYDHQLVGLAVWTTEEVEVGTVAEVLHAGPQDLLVVRRAGQEDALVPFVGALVPVVDLAAGRLVVADRPGLLAPAEEE